MHKIHKKDKEHLIKLRANVIKFTEKLIKNLDIADNNILEIGPQTKEGIKPLVSNARVFTMDIVSKNNPDIVGDICQVNNHIETEFFDAVICTEVLEHTSNPFDAIKELHRILKPEGELWLTTPFNFRIHGPSNDCWRFTEQGLRTLLKNWSKISVCQLESDRFLFPIQYTVIATK